MAKASMPAFFATFYLVSSMLCLGQTPVMFPLSQMFGGNLYLKSFTVQAAQSWVTDGTNAWVGVNATVTPSGGTNPIVYLTPNTYLITFPDATYPWRIAVPNTTNLLNAINLSTGPLPTFLVQPFTPIISGPGVIITNIGGTNIAMIDPSLIVTNGATGVSLSNLTVNGASPITASIGSYFSTGTLTNSYLITNSPFPWLNITVFWNQFLSTNFGALVYTNMATNGLPVFLAYGDPGLAGLLNNINDFWDISTNFNNGTQPFYVNLNSAQDNNSDLTNLFGSVWEYYPGSLQSSVQILAQQAAPVYRLFMFQPAFSALTNQVIAFAGMSPLNPSPVGVVFTDTNAGVNNAIRDVCHVAYTDNTGKTTYLLTWSHYGVGQGMGLATSPDDVNYTFGSYVPLSSSATFSNQACWSPKIFINATNGLEVTALLGLTNSGATPTNIFVGELNPLTFTNPGVMRVLTTDAAIGGGAALYSQGLYYYYSSSGIVWTNTTLASTGWKSSWTNGSLMVGGTVCSFAGSLYWFSTFSGAGLRYSTATNYAGPWSADTVLPFPAPDYAQGDGTFLQVSGAAQSSILSPANNTLNGTFAGAFFGNVGGVSNVPAAQLVGTVPTGSLTSGTTNAPGHLLVVVNNSLGIAVRETTYNGSSLSNLANSVPAGSTTNILVNIGGSGATVGIPLSALPGGGGSSILATLVTNNAPTPAVVTGSGVSVTVATNVLTVAGAGVSTTLTSNSITTGSVVANTFTGTLIGTAANLAGLIYTNFSIAASPPFAYTNFISDIYGTFPIMAMTTNGIPVILQSQTNNSSLSFGNNLGILVAGNYLSIGRLDSIYLAVGNGAASDNGVNGMVKVSAAGAWGFSSVAGAGNTGDTWATRYNAGTWMFHTNILVQGTTISTNGYASYATNMLSATATGITNTLTVNIRVCGFVGVSVLQSNSLMPYIFSRGTITTAEDITLQPKESLTGASGCSASQIITF